MTETREFKTKTMFHMMDMPKIQGDGQHNGVTIAAIDGGYSAVKGIGPTKGFIFPSYAKRIKDDMQIIGEVADSSIFLRDHTTNTLWAVGELAHSMIEKEDIESTTDQYLFDRYRYQTDIFRIIMTAGLGICMMGTLPSNQVKIQTGLPSTYKNDDTDELKEILAGLYDFDIKVGNEDWIKIKKEVAPEDIDVMEQPQGTLFGLLYDQHGQYIAENKSIMKNASTLIYDIGFNTEDIYQIERGVSRGHQTYSDTGMKAVFESVIQKINSQYHTAFKVFEFQRFLEKGKAVYFDRNDFGSKAIDFTKLLNETNEEIGLKSITRLMQTYSNLQSFDNLVVTGGTGESRIGQIRSLLAGVRNYQYEPIKILAGNMNDTSLPFSFSNVRGYYMYQYNKVKKAMA